MKKNLFCQLSAAAILFIGCVAGVSAAEIGVAGKFAQSYLKFRNVEFDALEPGQLNAENLKNYKALIWADQRPDSVQFSVLRDYVDGGGILYWGFPWKKDLAGAVCASGGYSPGGCVKVKAESEHPLTAGFKVGEWVEITHPVPKNIAGYSPTHGLQAEFPQCKVLFSVAVAKPDGKGGFIHDGEPKEYPWLTVFQYGRGTVITGFSGMFRYADNLEGYRKPSPELQRLLANLIGFLTAGGDTVSGAVKPGSAPGKASVASARLSFEMDDCNPGQHKPVLLNGVEIGEIPSRYGRWLPAEMVIPADKLHAVATVNTIAILNPDQDPFKVRNFQLQVTDKSGNLVSSDRYEGVVCSSTRVWSLAEGAMPAYNGAPLPLFSLTLPLEPLGFIPQPTLEALPLFKLRQSVIGRHYPGLAEAAINRPATDTSCWIASGEFLARSVDEIADKLKIFHAGEVAIFAGNKLDEPEQLDKIAALRKRGIAVRLAFGKPRPAAALLPGTDGYAKFFEQVNFWAPKVDIIGLDEWFFSPQLMATQGGQITNFTPELLDAFAEYAGISAKDALWVFEGKNKHLDDPRSRKAWEFCDKLQNDIAREFVRAARKANPEVKTWVSYIGHNWNMLVTSMDSAIGEFDEILDCQTYWYGRYADQPLNAAKITNPIGLGKIYEREYPGKRTWLGFGPAYAGGQPTGNDTADDKDKNRIWNHVSRYGNTPEEVLPYLALLYASGDGVFLFTAFNGNAPGDGSDNDFADVFRLASQLVPRIRDYVKSDIACCYDPRGAWESVRQGSNWFTIREGERISIGYLQQFCDVDVTSELDGYNNIAAAGTFLPELRNLEGKKLYLMYRPEYGRNGEKLDFKQAIGMDIEGFAGIPTGFYRLTGDVCSDRVMSYTGAALAKAENPLRKLSGDGREYIIGARNKAGNIRVNTFMPAYTWQNVMREVLRSDLAALGWLKRDCPQINGKKDIVAVAFREARKAVLDFGGGAPVTKVRILIFNGKDGITRNEVVDYKQGMEVELPPLNVLVASGILLRN